MLLVVPPQRCWFYIRTWMLIEEVTFIPLPDPDIDSETVSRGILYYLTTGNRSP